MPFLGAVVQSLNVRHRRFFCRRRRDLYPSLVTVQPNGGNDDANDVGLGLRLILGSCLFGADGIFYRAQNFYLKASMVEYSRIR